MEKIDDLIIEFVDEQPSTSQPPPSDSETNSEDSNSDTDDSKKPGRRAPRRPLSKLDPNLKGLMGEANLRYARGDTETAEKMCFEVMRQVPDAYEPYITLAQIFENSDPTKYEGYLSIASCLYPLDAGIWCRLAELNIQNGKFKEAISFYSKAIRATPRNMSLHVKRLELVEQTGDARFALACKRHMANKLPRSQHQKIIDLTQSVAEFYMKEKNYAKALEVLRIPFKRIPKKVTLKLINMMLEALLASERYTECVDILIQHCNFMFEIIVTEDNHVHVESYDMPANLQIDVKVKFITCLIKLKSFHLLPDLIDILICDEDFESNGNLYVGLADELMGADQSPEALKLLVPLVKTPTFNNPHVWLKYAECLHNCNMLEQAVEAYFTVMTMAPQHVEVLYPLAMTLLKLNKRSEALEVMSQDLSTNKLDVAVLIERLKLLKQINDLDEYWKCAEMLVSRHCVVVKYPEEAKVLIMQSLSVNEKVKKIKEIRRFREDLNPVESSFESIREPSVQTEFEVYKSILRFALETKQYAQLEKFAFMGLTSKRFVEYYKEIQLFVLFSTIYNNDTFHGYSLIRNVVINDTANNLAWNLFNIILKNTDDIRHNRFISRLQVRVPHIQCLQAMEANYSLSASNSNLAMKFYMREFRKHRLPYFSFILGLILLQGYSRRNVLEDKKKLAETASYLFLFYAKNRSRDAQQEVFYNVGRMYHQLGVMYLAEHYYLKALEEEEPGEMFGLKHEAAFNLHLIYKNSRNFTAARNVLIKHVVI